MKRRTVVVRKIFKKFQEDKVGNKLRELPEKWRGLAKQHNYDGGGWSKLSFPYLDCADELEKALAQQPVSEPFDSNGEYYNWFVVCPKCGREGRLDTYAYYRDKPAAPPAASGSIVRGAGEPQPLGPCICPPGHVGHMEACPAGYIKPTNWPEQDVRYPKQPCCDSAVTAASLRLQLIQLENWWHKEWHKATGIPCDGGSEYCPLPRRKAELWPAAQPIQKEGQS